MITNRDGISLILKQNYGYMGDKVWELDIPEFKGEFFKGRDDAVDETFLIVKRFATIPLHELKYHDYKFIAGRLGLVRSFEDHAERLIDPDGANMSKYSVGFHALEATIYDRIQERVRYHTVPF